MKLRAKLSIFIVGLMIQIFKNQAMFLERGRRGIVPCPLIASNKFTVEKVDSMYWYFKRMKSPFLLISHFQGKTAPQNGISEGVYNIDSNYSLIIENVTDLNEGNYFFKLKPKLKIVQDGVVPVTVKVSPNEPSPRVVGCHERPSDAECELKVASENSTHTCIVKNAKPVVRLQWLRVLGDGQTELINDTQTIQHTILPENTTNHGWFMINNTFTTSIQLTSVSTDTRYRCKAFGAALGDRSSSQMTVTINKLSLGVTDNFVTNDDIFEVDDVNAKDDNLLEILPTNSSVKPVGVWVWVVLGSSLGSVAFLIMLMLLACTVKYKRQSRKRKASRRHPSFI